MPKFLAAPDATAEAPIAMDIIAAGGAAVPCKPDSAAGARTRVRGLREIGIGGNAASQSDGEEGENEQLAHLKSRSAFPM